METKALDNVLSWMRGTDLVELAYKRGGDGFEFRLEGSSGEALPPFPASKLASVPSPGVGIWRSSAPGKPRRAEEGASVAAGDPLGLVDTGGRPIEVTAPVAGRIAKVLAEDGKPVEYGSPLFLIAP